MKKYRVPVLLVAFCLFFAGCASPQKEYNVKLGLGAYQEAFAIAKKEADKKNSDELLWRLQAGAAATYKGDSSESIRQFDLAEDIFQKNDTRSVFSKGLKGTGAMLKNDLVFDYNGNGLDRTFCCLYKAIDFAVMGKVNAARSEFNRAAQHQENWVIERKKDVAAAYDKLNKEASAASSKDTKLDGAQLNGIASDSRLVSIIKTNTGFDYTKDADLEHLAAYNYTSIYLAHLCGVFRWLDNDGGRNFLMDANKMSPQNPVLAQDFKDVDAGKRPGNNVWIYVEDGLCSHRQSWTAHFPTAVLPYAGQYALVVSMSFPVLKERLPASNAYFVETVNGSSQMVFLENIDRLVRTEYNIFMKGAIPREIARIIIRTGTQVALGAAAKHSRNSNAQLALKLLQVGAAAYSVATSEADTRSWESLPKNIYVQRVPCPADGKLKIKAGNMQTVELDIQKGTSSIVWMRRPTVYSPPTTKVITFKEM